MTIWCMRISCWIPKATNTHTHTQHVIPNAFPLQQWLHERVSMLRYTYIACIVKFTNKGVIDPKPKNYSLLIEIILGYFANSLKFYELAV